MPCLHDDPADMRPKSTLPTPTMKPSFPRSRVNHRFHVAPTDFARSCLANWIPPFVVTPELEALNLLKREWKAQAQSTDLPVGDDYNTHTCMIIADLYDFEVYQTPSPNRDSRNFELICLHQLDVPQRKQLSLNGFLCLGSVNIYVEGVSIQHCAVEGYADDESPEVTIYIQTQMASKDREFDVWFRVKRPNQYYKRFHEPFLCVAQLAKHALDYMEDMPPKTVSLENFREDFIRWVARRYPQNLRLQAWHALLNNRSDLRVDVNAYILYLHREAHGLPNAKALLKHPLWNECIIVGEESLAFKKQPKVAEHTLATPHVYDCWNHMYFSYVMKSMPMSADVEALQRRRKRSLGFAETVSTGSHKQPHCRPYGSLPVQVGDVVSFYPNEQDTSIWKGTKAAQIAKTAKTAKTEWFAYVQGTQTMMDGNQKLDVVWMYQPHDTTISIAKYSFPNELFFSDHCNCGDPKLLSSQIRGKHNIDWCPRSISPNTAFFVRQTYLTDSSFVTFKHEHKTCVCKKSTAPPSDKYRLGDTVYAKRRIDGKDVLNPVVFQGFNATRTHVNVRILLRLRLDCAELTEQVERTGSVADNELVLTNDCEYLPVSKIQRRCHIRFVKRGHEVPFPYNRGGAGDLWFISMGIVFRDNHRRLVYLMRLPKHFNEGDDMTSLQGSALLRGLSIFSGGGNFDRGLEEGGAVDFRYSVDMAPWAIHTQYANAKDRSNLYLYYGSVDDYMKIALSGVAHELVARVGDVHFIAAGSPCPGFSSLQQNPLDEKSCINASHITTLCSAVDLYRPSYAVLENVVAMAFTKTGREDQNILSHLVACFVSMGYQVNQYIMDSWNYGSGQRRSRVLVSIAAPGLDPIVQPWHTHSQPLGKEKALSLGELSNGQRFGQREAYPTPFASLSAHTITWDLPNIGNGNIQTCPSHPDHRVSIQPNRKKRALIKCIPRQPPGCGYSYSHTRGLIPLSLQVRGKEKGKSFTRIEALGLIPTITTGLSIQDSYNGANLHWSQDRPITLLEARRAQGYSDDEPIIGDLGRQYTVVGNGVDRKVAFAQGLALRQAVMSNLWKGGQDMLVDVEDEDDGLSDATVDDSVIDVHDPPSSTPAPPAQLGAETNLADLHERAAEKSSSRPRLDGLSDLRDSSSAIAVPKTTFFLDRMPATVTRALNDLSFRSQQSIPVSKRSRDEESALHSETDTHFLGEVVASRKRLKSRDTTALASFEGDMIEVRTDGEHSKTKTKTRQTRHSGLNIAFTPQLWNRRPEREYSAEESDL
ncbi:hypothetical protein BDU57DRAFT_516387 [Ampelomyces quisqualis]|uniref:DNA (cytosine-5-)-methyltransferase n=1 Tax=Ampelomyces quisqualis TaxID=50730 RepID=A0A6A5QNB3_AMPQU|nr:hypothetical protein BDU57DRAFT_516387 [Ampelomyces quisqualis]